MNERNAVANSTMELAVKIASEVTGHVPAKARRFEAGVRHCVYDVEFASRQPVVVRIGTDLAGSEMLGAVHLSQVLRPRGVPLPEMLASNIGVGLPWVVLERLPGTDLGAVIRRLSSEQLDRIALAVARAQAVTAQTASGGRCGYASQPEEAPHATWSKVLEANLARSQERIASVGVFDASCANVVRTVLVNRRDQIDRIEPTPFFSIEAKWRVNPSPPGPSPPEPTAHACGRWRDRFRAGVCLPH